MVRDRKEKGTEKGRRVQARGVRKCSLMREMIALQIAHFHQNVNTDVNLGLNWTRHPFSEETLRSSITRRHHERAVDRVRGELVASHLRR